MKAERLNQLCAGVLGVHSAAWSDHSGVVLASSDSFEGDVPCAVAAICRGQLEALGEMLGAKHVEDWAVAGAKMNVYVINQGSSSLVALGVRDDKPTKTAERIAAMMR